MRLIWRFSAQSQANDQQDAVQSIDNGMYCLGKHRRTASEQEPGELRSSYRQVGCDCRIDCLVSAVEFHVVRHDTFQWFTASCDRSTENWAPHYCLLFRTRFPGSQFRLSRLFKALLDPIVSRHP